MYINVYSQFSVTKVPGPRHQEDLPRPGLWAEAAGARDVARGLEDRILMVESNLLTMSL